MVVRESLPACRRPVPWLPAIDTRTHHRTAHSALVVNYTKGSSSTANSRRRIGGSHLCSRLFVCLALHQQNADYDEQNRAADGWYDPARARAFDLNGRQALDRRVIADEHANAWAAGSELDTDGDVARDWSFRDAMPFYVSSIRAAEIDKYPRLRHGLRRTRMRCFDDTELG